VLPTIRFLILLLTTLAYCRGASAPLLVVEQPISKQPADDSEQPTDFDPFGYSVESEFEEKLDKLHFCNWFPAAAVAAISPEAAFVVSPLAYRPTNHPLIYVLSDLRL